MENVENADDEGPVFESINFADRIKLFQKKAEEHRKKQLENPFSEWEGPRPVNKLDKSDENYGRPVEGSKTDLRGKKAHESVSNEVRVLCQMIKDYGEELSDGSIVISFGDLFQLYTHISNKVVGILLRARKHGFVQFEGEMLFQRRDDNVPIRLVQMPS
ncbi:actin-binding Rho-activating protein-like protein [Dinothrombium tinctorium]|uniref:Actin-binding Rho-activating protein-like protein n=1 Tax=Dinothrombium tinctorium TaxID=1965070 RepID=A0A3S3NIM6_9ACAR|nr:actin-binding Rho-activating protein-like protein [Dinothrombium tinctorium]RWS01233.1 actin-binding Rho-activating protein-like protein [Dinothrombium tinctorium]RWS01234.1 actin-binding Rho-activating protein-like protein [Dinothrombium tinctorium]RWS03049.1 actin-binding Rho-activating protein-like protein [Dinothrombium tinctorium]